MVTIRNKRLLICIIITITPWYLVVPFACGFCGCSQTYGWIPLCLAGPPVAGVIAAFTVNTSALKTIAVGFGVAIGATVVLFASLWAFAGIDGVYTFGIGANFKLTKHPDRIQQWATQAIEQYEDGHLAVTTNMLSGEDCILRSRLEDSDVPSQIRGSWADKPCIGMVMVTDNGSISDSIEATNATLHFVTWGNRVPVRITYCVDISWGDHGRPGWTNQLPVKVEPLAIGVY